MEDSLARIAGCSDGGVRTSHIGRYESGRNERFDAEVREGRKALSEVQSQLHSNHLERILM